MTCRFKRQELEKQVRAFPDYLSQHDRNQIVIIRIANTPLAHHRGQMMRGNCGTWKRGRHACRETVCETAVSRDAQPHEASTRVYDRHLRTTKELAQARTEAAARSSQDLSAEERVRICNFIEFAI